MRHSRAYQVSIRTLFALTFIAAIAVVIWMNRPSGPITIRMSEDGSLSLGLKPISKEDLSEKLTSSLRWHRLWRSEPDLMISVPGSVRVFQLDEIKTIAAPLGFQKTFVGISEGTNSETAK